MDFTTLLSLVLNAEVAAAVLAAVAVDYGAFRAFKSWNDLAAYEWGVATFRAFQGLGVGIITHLGTLGLPTLLEGIRRVAAGVLIVSLVAGSAACAKVNPALVAADDAVTASLTNASGQIRRVCENPALAAPCQDVRPVVSEALGAAIEFNRAIAAQKPTALGPLMDAVGRLAKAVTTLPEGETAAILRELAGAIAAARIAGGE